MRTFCKEQDMISLRSLSRLCGSYKYNRYFIRTCFLHGVLDRYIGRLKHLRFCLIRSGGVLRMADTGWFIEDGEIAYCGPVKNRTRDSSFVVL